MTMSNNVKRNSKEKDFHILESFSNKNIANTFKKRKTINALLLGDKSVGKTSIGKRLTGDLGIDVLLAETYGIDFHFLKIDHNNISLNIQIWDVSFQSYECDNPEFFIKNTDIIVLVFSESEEDSFRKLKNYSKYLEKYDSKLKILISNKIDLHHKNMLKEEIENFSEKYNLPYYKVSALKGTNFEYFKKELIKKIKMYYLMN